MDNANARPGDERGWMGRLSEAVPILRWLPQYQKSWAGPDLVAGLTLAAYAIPVAVAYASLAGLPPQAGLYCYLVGGIAYAIFGTSRQVAVGPTSAISILIGSALGTVAAGDLAAQQHLASAVALLAGIIGILAWLLRLGNITHFISETVLSGFKVGAGLVIASTQLPKLFGVTSGGNNFFTRIIDLLRHLSDTNIATFGVGLAALVMLIIGDKLLPRRPVPLLVVAIWIALMTWTPLASKGVKVVGTIPEGLPAFGWPVVQWTEVDVLLGVALACFLLSYVESVSVARTFSLKHKYPISADQELLALGAANLAAGLGQAYPLAGGMSQSAVNEKAGARSSMALVFASGGIALVLLFFTGLLRQLPQPVLAAVVLIAVGSLIKPAELRHLHRVSRPEFHAAMVATLGVLAFGILKGVLLAAIFSILALLKRSSQPRIAVLQHLPAIDRFVDASRYPGSSPVPNVLVLRIEAGIFYFNAENVKSAVLAKLRQCAGTDLVVLDLSTSANIDLAGVHMLRELREQVAHTGASLALADAHGHVRDLLRAEGLGQEIPGIIQRMRIAALIDEMRRATRAAG